MAIAAVQPDLILMNSGSYYQELYDQVSQIAPTVAFASWPDDSNKATWQEFFINMATALEMEAEAQEVIDAWQTRVENLAATVPVDTKELSVVRIMPETLMTYMKGSYSGTVLEAAGIKQVPSQEIVSRA